MRPSAPTLRYAAINAAYWAGFCLVMAFSSVFLLARGLSNGQIGATLAASGLISALLQPVFADLAGRSRWPLRYWAVGVAVLMAAAASGLMLPNAVPLRDALLFGALLLLVQLVLPLVNALGMDAARAGIPVDFGRARAFGSLAFAATSSLVGLLVAGSGPGVLPPLVIVAQVALALATVTFVFAGAAHSSVASSSASSAVPADLAQLAEPVGLVAGTRRLFVLLLIGLTATFVSHAAINTFLFQVVSHHGGTSSHMGLAFTIAAGVEMLPMLFFSRIIRRWGPGTLLRFAAVGFAVKAVLTLLAPNLTLLLATMLLQAISFGVVIPASVYYVDRLLPAVQRVRGQAQMTLTLTLGNVVAGLGGGYLLDASGVPALLAAGAAASVVGVLFVVAGTRTARPLR